WAAVDAMRSASPLPLRRAMYAGAFAASVASWALFARQYVPLVYPSDALYALRIDTTRLTTSQRRCEMKFWHWDDSPGPLDRATRAPLVARRDVVLVNFCQGTPSRETRPAPGCGTELFRAPHFMAFPAYGFEGLTPDQRAEIARPEYDLR